MRSDGRCRALGAPCAAARARTWRRPFNLVARNLERGAMAQTADCRLCGRSFVRCGRHAHCKRCAAKADRAIARDLRADCKECDKPFSTDRRSVRYCSDACRADARRRSSREHGRRRLMDPRKRAVATARVRAIMAGRRAVGAGGPPKRGRGRQRKRADGGAAASRTLTCKLCGRSFELRGMGIRSYCRRCAAMADREAARKPRRQCKECGKKFDSKAHFVRYCSDECSAKVARRRERRSNRRRSADPEKSAIAAARSRAYRGGRKAGRA